MVASGLEIDSMTNSCTLQKDLEMGQLTTSDNMRKIAVCCVTGRGTKYTVLACAILAIIGILSLGDDHGNPFLALKTMLAETGPVKRMTMDERAYAYPPIVQATWRPIDAEIEEYVRQINGEHHLAGIPQVDLRSGGYALNKYLPSAGGNMSFDEETGHWGQITADDFSEKSLLSNNFASSRHSTSDADLEYWNEHQGSGAVWRQMRRRQNTWNTWWLAQGQDVTRVHLIARNERRDRCATRFLTVCSFISCMGIAYTIGAFIYKHMNPSS